MLLALMNHCYQIEHNQPDGHLAMATETTNNQQTS